MIRLLFLVHRYLGIGVGFVLLLWCLSGFVMMYVQFPELDGRARLAIAPALELAECCEFPANPGLSAVPFTYARLEMLDARTPVLRAGLPQAAALNIDVRLGREYLSTEDLGDDVHIAADFRARELGPGPTTGPELVGTDQWTITAEYNPHRPLLKYSAEDEAGTQWYVSGKSGEIVLVTTARQRIWNYLGAIVHWLYPSLLRSNTALWSQTVIWLSLLGGFLTITGLYIGIMQFGRRRSGKFSPYRGLGLWHHYAGLVFGVITLIWVLSGTLSMNPWGLLEGEGSALERDNLRGGHLNWTQIREVLQRATRHTWPQDTVRLELIKLLDEPYLVATQRSGQQTRYSPDTFAPALLDTTQWQALSVGLLGATPALESTLLNSEDAYYYDHRRAVILPVYRIRSDDEQKRIYYLSGNTGELILKVDNGSRWYRWLFTGLHSADFFAALRSRPLWDMVMWLFLIGTTLVCGTGTWMAVRRLRRT